MPNWKKVIVSGSSAEITTLKLTGTSGQSSEGTSLMINSSGVVGTRELGSNAFNSNTYNNYSLPLAASGTRGGVKIGFTEEGKNYPVELSSEKMYVNVPWTDNNTTYSVGDGGLTQKNFTSTLKTKLDGIATGATNTSAPFYTSAISVGDGGLTQKNFTTTLKNKLDGIATGATNVTNNNQIDNGAGYITSYTDTNTVDMGDGFQISNSAGEEQFTVIENEEIRFEGSDATSVSFDASTQKVTISSTDNNTTYSVGDGGLTQKNFTSTLKTKLDGIATGATNTSAPFYTSAISVGDGGLTQKNFTSTLKTKLDGIAASANNFSIAVSINEGEGVAVSSGGTQDFSAGSNVTLTQAVGGAIEISSTDNNTTYSVGDGGLTQKNFTSTLKTKLDGIATSATNVTNNNQIDNGAGYITSFTNTTYLLKATQYDGGNTDPYIKLDANSGTDDYIQLRGSGATSITRDDDGQITISSTDTNTNTTYTAGDGLDSSGTTFTHGNTSGQSSVNNSGNTVVQDVSLDEYGHVTGMVSATLDIPSNNNQLDNGEGFTTNTGTVTGTGSSNRIARWSSSTNISSVSDLTFDGVTLVAGSDGSTGGRVRTGDGSTSAPAFSFVGDTNTGFYSSTTDTIAATTGGTQRLTINSNGMKVNNGALGVNVNANSTDGRIDASNDIVAYSSDKRLKENIKVIETPLDKLDKLSGFTYNWNEKANKIAGFDKEESMVGVFAQDVESVLPEAVKRAPFDNDGEDGSKSGENYLTVQYEKLVPLLIESIKELKSEIEELKRGK